MVSCPEEAVNVLSENKHDICLLDYRLGASDGLEALKVRLLMGSVALSYAHGQLMTP